MTATGTRTDSRQRALEVGRRTLEVEARVLERLRDQLSESFTSAVDLLLACPGRIIVTGMGKSGIVAHKIAATLASTGTPSLFLHPAEAVHGDLGMITPKDVVLAISNSGETEEVLALLPVLELMKVPFVAMASRPGSTLARAASCYLHLPVEDEGCPIGLAPMASTTASLALGDALASALMERRGFKPSDFAVFHPRGSLGRRLLTRVRDLMVPLAECSPVAPGTPMRQVLDQMISSNLGALLVVDGQGLLAGILTDGDLKRMLRDRPELSTLYLETIERHMTRSPTVCEPDILAEAALRTMEERPGGQITVLPVVEENRRALGLIRLHDIVKAKIK